MDNFILLAKSIGILSLFYVVYVAVLRRNTLFNANRRYLIAGIIAAIILPFVQFTRTIIITLPSQPEPLFFTNNYKTPIILDPTTIAEIPFSVDWWQVALIIYILGVLVLLIRLSTQILSLQRLIAAGTIVSKNRYTYVSISENVAPFSFFTYIVYNPELHTVDELEMILAHEQVHASQWHSVDILLTQLILAIQWFNPFTWLYKRSLEQNLEYIADHEAVQQLSNTQQYQRTLVKVSSPTYRPALTNQFYQSFIKKRIIMLNTPQSRKQSIWKLGIILPILALFMYSFNVTEVTEYVEEETPAFAKAETTPNNTFTENIFLITPQSTSEDLDKIEKAIAAQYPESLVRFSNRRIADQGIVKRFSFQTKFDGDSKFNTRFDRTTDIKAGWEGYEIQITNEQEIVVEEKGDNGVSFKMDVDKLVFLDVNGTVFDRALVPSNEKYDESKKGTYARVTNNPPVTLRDSIIKMSSITIADSPLHYSSPSLQRSTPAAMNAQDTYSFIITKNTEPWELDSLKKVLKEKHGATLTIKNVDYNSDGEITSIRLDFKDASGNNKNYTVQSSSPIKDIYIYREADGRTGMGNAGSSKEAEASFEKLRDQMKERRNAMMQQRDSMRVGINANREERRAQMEERREEMRTRMEENRNLQGKANVDSMPVQMTQRRDSMRVQMKERRDEMRARMKENRSLQGRGSADSLRSQMTQRRDSMKAQMMQRRNSMRSARGNATQTSDKAKAGYIKLDDDTYYYVNKDDGSVAYYNRWGVEIKEGDEKYESLRTAPNSSVDGDTQNDVVKRLERYQDTNIRMSAAYIYYVNDKKVTYEEFLKLDPDNIEHVSVLKGKAAVKLYGKEAEKGVILIETKN